MQNRNPFDVGMITPAASAVSSSEIELIYDYEHVIENSRDREVAIEYARIIKRARNRIEADLLLIGQSLLAVKERKLFPTAQFANWVLDEFGIQPRQSQRMMNVARVYGDREDANQLLSAMGDSVAIMAAAPSVPDEARQVIEEKALAGERLSAREARRVIRRVREYHREIGDTVEAPVGALPEEVAEDHDVEQLRDQGWELRKVAAVGTYYCYNPQLHRATYPVESAEEAWDDAAKIKSPPLVARPVTIEMDQMTAVALLDVLRSRNWRHISKEQRETLITQLEQRL